MVTRLLFILALLAATGCNTDTSSAATEQETEFDPQQFDLEAFTGRVHRFLRSRTETKGHNRYDVLFVNTEHCTACMRGSLGEIVPFLEKADRDLFIYANDSSLLELVPENDHLRFVWLPLETYRSADIFHNKMYLYEVKNDRIRSVNLDLRRIDSLNNLY